MLDTLWKKHFCENLNLCSLYALIWLCTEAVVPVVTEYMTRTQSECCLYLNSFCISLSYSCRTHLDKNIFVRTPTWVHFMHWNDSALQWMCQSLQNTWPQLNQNVCLYLNSFCISLSYKCLTHLDNFFRSPTWVHFMHWNDSAVKWLSQS